MKIRAEIHFYINSGRKSNFTSGYRPMFRVRDDDMMNDGIIEFIDKKFAAPGETIIGSVKFVFPQYVKDYLHIGKKIVFGEGRLVMGKCTVLEIIEN